MDLSDIFGGPPEIRPAKTKAPPAPKETAQAVEAESDESLRAKAQEAADAHDAASAAEAKFRSREAELQQGVDEALAPLLVALKLARERRTEAIKALDASMEGKNVTKIPMGDRPHIKVKITKGSKKSITKKWLVDAKGVAVKTLDTVLAGESEFKTGEEVAAEIWKIVPIGKGKRSVVIPDRYDDEPDPG